ncbi:MAG: putative DNA base hypermodification protein [Patescibacteria group bacterium]|nr:putative DNA base hypermodification protein [Patescibacteria group bacterium]
MINTKEKEFFNFIFDRQLLWYKRFCEKANIWTKDKILQKYKFCNVYRELDKGTSYIIEKLKDIKDRKVIFQNIVFYRFFNKYNLYEDLKIDIIKKFDNRTIQLLTNNFNNLKKSGKTIFNDAYLISGNKTNEAKHIFILNNLQKIFESKSLEKIIQKIDISKTPEESLEIIKEIPSVGNFLAYEIWVDLSYFNFFKNSWTDNDFVNIGPGAKWGLELIYNRKLKNIEQLEKIYHLYGIQNEYLDKIKKNNTSWQEIAHKKCFSNYPYLSIRNIEHSLCEFRKYTRLKEGLGKKRYYK